MKINVEPKFVGVQWMLGKDFSYETLTPENLHAVLRMMQIRPGKDYFKIVKI